MINPNPLSAKLIISDATIENAVEDELFFDPAVPTYLIDIKCKDGIVTLSGTVHNILAKERAVVIAETVKSVKSIVNLIQVSVINKKTDNSIERDISQALIDNPATERFEIHLNVKDSHVTLNGTVDSFREKKLVETVVKGVDGVKSVENNIALSLSPIRSDTELLSDIQQALRWNALIDHELIKVDVEKGSVRLTGAVGSAAEKREAEKSSWVRGVQNVDTSSLKIRYWARYPILRKTKYNVPSDEKIKEAINAALEQDPRISASGVSVFVSDGIATLKGRVDNLKSSRVAAQDARNTVGISLVRNSLKVKPMPIFINDSELEQKIENAFKRDTYVNDFNISVQVSHGVADLFGKVDTLFQKVRAEDVASMIQGIYIVNNNLQVQRTWTPYYFNPYVDEIYLNDYGWYVSKRMNTEKSDSEILDAIQRELLWSPFVDAHQITVKVDDGKATLTGKVDSMMEYNAATENAQEGGAVSVDNELVISSHQKKDALHAPKEKAE